jgi:hypothetical protein
MTKAQIVGEISKRLGDPEQVAFADRIWGYFTESLYEIMAKSSPTEMMNMSNRQNGIVLTDIEGKARLPKTSTQIAWNDILSVKVAGIPATMLNDKEYQMMLTDTMYRATTGEAFFFIDGDIIVILTGYIATNVSFEVVFIDDMHRKIGDAADSTEITIPSTMIYKAYPLTVDKIKREVGITL